MSTETILLVDDSGNTIEADHYKLAELGIPDGYVVAEENDLIKRLTLLNAYYDDSDIEDAINEITKLRRLCARLKAAKRA